METLKEQLGRLRTVEKTINETSKTLRVQPVGGLGAMLQTINSTPVKVKKPTTVLFANAGSSSLPYLSDEQKVKSNENILILSAHIAQQKETAKASYLYDEVETSKLEDRIEDNIRMVANNYTPETKDLLRQYLIKELTKRKREEDEIINRRRDRDDEELNPFVYDNDNEETRTHYSGLTPSSGRSEYGYGGSVVTTNTLGRPQTVNQERVAEIAGDLGRKVMAENKVRDKANLLDLVRGLKTVQAKKISEQLEGTPTKAGLKSREVQKLLLDVPSADRPKITILKTGEVREPSDAEVKKLSRRLATEAVIKGLQKTKATGERTLTIPKSFLNTARRGNVSGGGRPLALGSGV